MQLRIRSMVNRQRRWAYWNTVHDGPDFLVPSLDFMNLIALSMECLVLFAIKKNLLQRHLDRLYYIRCIVSHFRSNKKEIETLWRFLKYKSPAAYELHGDASFALVIATVSSNPTKSPLIACVSVCLWEDNPPDSRYRCLCPDHEAHLQESSWLRRPHGHQCRFVRRQTRFRPSITPQVRNDLLF